PGQRDPADRPAVDLLHTADHRGRVADHHLLGRLHGSRSRPPEVLRLHEPVHRVHAAARAGRQLPGALRRVGGRRPGLLPAHRVLAGPELGGGGGEEGVRGEPGRRRRPDPGHLLDVQRVRDGVLYRGVPPGAVRRQRGGDRAGIPAAARRGSYGLGKRQYAAVKFLLYSLLGGLLMLVAVIALYVYSVRSPATGHHGSLLFSELVNVSL